MAIARSAAAPFDRNDPRAVRRAVRTGAHAGHTAGLAPGYVQGNVCILPRDYADDFFVFCQRNPKPCPLLGASDPGDPRLPALAEDLDIRTDVPGYRVFRNGEHVEDVADIRGLWRDDLVAFVLGCSFSFEEALVEAGLPLRYVEQGKNVPMFLTNIDTAPAGPFRGDPTEVRADELPLFWACGVTPQSVVRNARPPLCITHAPGHMLVTDLKNASLAVL
jgi:uncharacterized protein YcsI (UPF0317 family)